jgi:hypothetical protein
MTRRLLSIIPAAEVAPMVHQLLVDSVESEYKGSPQEEKDLAVYHILETLSRAWFS